MLATSLHLLLLALLPSLTEASKNYVVTVGQGSKLEFVPATLDAAVGDTITYKFFAKNHAVVQSDFDHPCQPLDNGFFSGFVPTASPDVASATDFTITINDTSKTIWAYCPQTNGDHCQKGMVHAINVKPGGKSLDDYKKAAATAPTSKTPASPKPAGGKRRTSVTVGAGGELKFVPNNITELAGTVLQFDFNPKNHSVVQSSFDKPCQPLDHGFSSGFVPTANSPSGALFEVVVPNDGKPIWFYCAQTTGTHCQKGMVGSVNAPPTGDKTLADYIASSAKTNSSSIGPQAPVGGTFTFQGNAVASFNGAVFLGASSGGAGTNSTTGTGTGSGNSTSPDLGWTSVPPPGDNTTSQTWGMAGGSQPNSYQWGAQISDNATNALHLLEWLDNILLDVLTDGYGKLNGGAWSKAYPKSIVDTIGAMTAQALVHRSTSTDSLAHFQKPIHGLCKYKNPNSDVDAFLSAVLTLLLLEIGVLIDVSALVAVADPWLVPALATQVGSKARMTAVVNMMQNHLAASAVREVMIPRELAYSYAWNAYISSCPDKLDGMPDKPYPSLQVTKQDKDAGSGRVTKITFDTSASSGDKWIAWVGPWGSLEFTKVENDGSAVVPAGLYGHVWAVLTSKQNVPLREVAGVTIAGPAMIWVAQP